MCGCVWVCESEQCTVTEEIVHVCSQSNLENAVTFVVPLTEQLEESEQRDGKG